MPDRSMRPAALPPKLLSRGVGLALAVVVALAVALVVGAI